MKRLLVLICGILLSSSVTADNLYKVRLTSEAEAEKLAQSSAQPIYRLNDGYLVLTDEVTAGKFEYSSMEVDLVATDISIEEIVVDTRLDRDQPLQRDPLFQQEGVSILRMDHSLLTEREQRDGLRAIGERDIEFVYTPSFSLNDTDLLAGFDIDSLVDLVEQDSLYSYIYTMQDFKTRLTGTYSNRVCSDWLKEKFESWGYDSVRFEEFVGSQLWDRVPCDSRNVIAVKPGVVYPDRQIIVGAHFDAVPDCPGADDNASGTAGVLEVARILADVETEHTFVFIGFDSEESWMWGSYDYADRAFDRKDDIVLMFNLDMIAHENNDEELRLYHGPQLAYAELCARLSDSLADITSVLKHEVGASDHLPFHELGWDVLSLWEYNWSTHYHEPTDSIQYLDLEYATRIVKATLATARAVDVSAKPVMTMKVEDVGDGQSLKLHWRHGTGGPILIPENLDYVDHYEIHAVNPVSGAHSSASVAKPDTCGVVSGLIQGEQYLLHAIIVDTTGRSSLAYNELPGVPTFYPALPENQAVESMMYGVRVKWTASNIELDFDHYAVLRDGLLVADFINDTVYEDTDPALGEDFHDFLVVAVDSDGNISDTTGAEWLSMRAATLNPSRILAVNRTKTVSGDCDREITRDFMLQALEGLDYDFLDPYTGGSNDLPVATDMFSYELVVIGAESGYGIDDIGGATGILPELDTYLNLGGKAVIFGRWGSTSGLPGQTAYLNYSIYPNSIYFDRFHTLYRFLPLTSCDYSDSTSRVDLIGGHSLRPEYPSLVWDPDATYAHTEAGICTAVDGIPCPSIPSLNRAAVDTLYTYDSRVDSSNTEGRAVVWRYLGGPHQYVFFDLPLSFMEREPAVMALRQAISDVGIDVGDDHDGDGIANEFDNCRFLANPDQADADGDGAGDVCDLCPGTDDFVDADGDYIPDGCDICSAGGDLVDRDEDGVPDPCDACADFDDAIDSDADSVPDGCDNCVEIANADQADTDGDGVGDSCDACPGHNDLSDPDTDGLASGCDNCPNAANPDQDDFDGDGVGDMCDACPGHDDLADADGDTVPDSCDICPGHSDYADADGDAVPDGCDLCAGQNDALDDDGDTVPDGCDMCAGHNDLLDDDGDTVPDGCDECAGYDDLADADEDTVPDGCDICEGYNDLADADADSHPDSCDNCPDIHNPDQADGDGDGVGDLCDGCCGKFTDGFTGNCNCSDDGKMTLSDISALIDRIFVSKQELCCEENGNVNGSEDGKLTLADVTGLIDHIYISKEATAPCY